MKAFRAKLEPVPHGGCYVVVPPKVAEQARLVHAARVRGTVNGAPYRSSLMKYSGIFHLGVHKATLASAKTALGERVAVTIELDDEPLPTDVIPDDLAAALRRDAQAAAAFAQLRPSLRREFVKQLLTAKRAETRARRLTTILERLAAQPR